MPSRIVPAFFALFAFGLAVVDQPCRVQSAAEADVSEHPQLRRPVAIVAVDRWVYVANRRSGTISVIDAKRQTVIGEQKIGGMLAGLVATPDGRFLLVLDEEHNQLLAIRRGAASLRIVGRVDVPPSPSHIDLSADGKLCAVTSRWPRRLTFVEIAQQKGPSDNRPVALTVRDTLDLPFAPGVLRFVQNDRRLIAADAFGGRLAVVDAVKRELLAVHVILGHNIRGLSASHDGRELHVPHQLLDANSTTTHEHVFWGGVMKNFVRSIPFDKLLASAITDDSLRGDIYPLGHPSGAAGDPGTLLVTTRGEAALVLSGVDQIGLRRRPIEPFVRREVGRRPTALCLSPDERMLYVANMLDDSISVVDMDTLQVGKTISLGPQPTLQSVDRGERLFYDARLSLDGWYSCHSCHTDGHTNNLLNDNFGDDYFGDPKRVPSLLGTGRTHPWTWTGKTLSLEKQIHKSITVTMQGEQPSVQTTRDLAAFLRTLEPPPALSVARRTVNRQEARRGRQVFEQRGCIDCHAPPAYTTPETYDVGLSDKSGNKQFNPPSLLGVSQRRPYFHDNRAKSLRDVLTRHRHQLDQPLPEAQLKSLLEFLRSL